MFKKYEKVPAVIVSPNDDPEFGGSILNTNQWDRIVIVDENNKKVAEITSDDVTPATGYLAKLYPTTN